MSARSDVLLFVGPPGSGKGTLSRRCVKELDYKQLSTGDLCRQHIAQGTSIGKAIDLAIKSGKLVDDALIADMVKEWFLQAGDRSRVILDGFPRTVVQARVFGDFVAKQLKHDAVSVVRLTVSQDVVVNRLGARVVCSKNGCQAVYSTDPHSPFVSLQPNICDRCASALIKRPDDEVSAIVERLKIYGMHEVQLLAFYETLGYKMVTLDAGGAADDIFAQFARHLSSE